jgi:predicted transcriptional regulator
MMLSDSVIYVRPERSRSCARMPVRTTVYLDDGLAERVRRLAPRRRMTRFINEAVELKVAALEREQLEREMREGYIATDSDEERAEIVADWAVLDADGWPE